MKINFSLFYNLLKNYSSNLSSIFQNIKDEKEIITPKYCNELKSNIFNLGKAINEHKIKEILSENKSVSSNINDTKIFFDEFKIWVEELVDKYEKKIQILKNEYEEAINTINKLSYENSSLKEELENEKQVKLNIIKKLKQIKDDNNSLIKQNKILDLKCTEYFNLSTKNKYNQKNFVEEIDYKNKIIKYLENILKDNNNIEIKKSYNQIMDLKKNIHGIINNKKIMNDNKLKDKKPNKINCLSCNINNIIENEHSFLNQKNISSISNRSKKDAKVKKEIKILDNEIEEIQKKLDEIISTQTNN